MYFPACLRLHPLFHRELACEAGSFGFQDMRCFGEDASENFVTKDSLGIFQWWNTKMSCLLASSHPMYVRDDIASKVYYNNLFLKKNTLKYLVYFCVLKKNYIILIY